MLRMTYLLTGTCGVATGVCHRPKADVRTAASLLSSIINAAWIRLLPCCLACALCDWILNSGVIEMLPVLHADKT